MIKGVLISLFVVFLGLYILSHWYPSLDLVGLPKILDISDDVILIHRASGHGISGAEFNKSPVSWFVCHFLGGAAVFCGLGFGILSICTKSNLWPDVLSAIRDS
jgi:hypothetical protein